MKGFAIEFLGAIMASAFIIIVTVILLQNFLPSVFGETLCAQKQIDTMNGIVNTAVAARSTTVRDFTVENCIEYVDFTNVLCEKGANPRFGRSSGSQTCYEILKVGQVDGNCYTQTKVQTEDPTNLVTLLCKQVPDPEDPNCKPTPNSNCKLIKDPSCKDDCSLHKGTLIPFPGGINTFEVLPYRDSESNTPSSLKYGPGKYLIEIGPYSIKFLQAPK